MRAFLCLLALGAAIAVPAPASAEPAADALERLGLAGRWSSDCARHVASNNPDYFTHFERAGDGARFRLGPVVRKIENVRAGPGKTIAFRMIVPPDAGLSVDLVMEFLGDRFRYVSSVTLDGKSHIRDGLNIATGTPVHWFSRCPQ